MLENLTSITILAVFVEGFVSYFISDPDKKQPWIKYAAAAIGIVLAFAYRIDLFALFGIITYHPYIGQIITGTIIGRGSNYLNDIISFIRNPKAELSTPEEVHMEE